MEIGVVKKNTAGLDFVVINKNMQKSTTKHTYYDIRFLDSGYECCCRSDTINSGCVRDKLSISVCNVACVGYIDVNSHKHEYRVWSGMINRCYNKSDMSYKYYGGKGVSVCKRWLTFEYFYKDISLIRNYDATLFHSGQLQLDKDIYSDLDDKIYSLETTCWITHQKNQERRAIEHNLKNKKYAKFPDGHIEEITHVTNFCKNNGLHRQNVNLCLAGKQSQTKGFVFYKE